MKIIITAGGTSERIDDVRTITNSSTGKLGFTIGSAFAEAAGNGENIEKIYYLHGVRAVYPQHDKVQPVMVEGVRDLQRELGRLLETEKIDAVIHAMAVSDYMVNEVTTLDRIRGEESEDSQAPFRQQDKLRYRRSGDPYEKGTESHKQHQKAQSGLIAGGIQTPQQRASRRTDICRKASYGKERL